MIALLLVALNLSATDQEQGPKLFGHNLGKTSHWLMAQRVGDTQAKAAEAVPKLSAVEPGKLLSGMETRLGQSLADYTLASSYRARCAASKQHDRAIQFFQQMISANPANQRARLELGCAFVDKIPTCGGVAALLSKGTLARKSLDQFDAYLVTEPDSWIGNYARGINHLHWPRALRHSADAVQDLQRCVELQQQIGKSGFKPHFLLPYVALGDAYTKDKQMAKARKAWGEGLKLFPEAKGLKDRLAIQDDTQLLKYVESQRSLDQPIDTDLSFLDREP